MRLVAITGWEIVFEPSKMFKISKFFPFHMGMNPELFNFFFFSFRTKKNIKKRKKKIMETSSGIANSHRSHGAKRNGDSRPRLGPRRWWLCWQEPTSPPSVGHPPWTSRPSLVTNEARTTFPIHRSTRACSTERCSAPRAAASRARRGHRHLLPWEDGDCCSCLRGQNPPEASEEFRNGLTFNRL